MLKNSPRAQNSLDKVTPTLCKTICLCYKFSLRFSGNVSLGGGPDPDNLTAALRDLYTTMDKGNTVPPIIMLQVLHNAFPRFAERGEGGGYQQQDANECWMEILRMLQVLLRNRTGLIM